jgi:hypothetical protein
MDNSDGDAEREVWYEVSQLQEGSADSSISASWASWDLPWIQFLATISYSPGLEI